MASPTDGNTLLNIDEDALALFENIVRIIGEIKRTSSSCNRIQRGSPGAGSLSYFTQGPRTDLVNLKPQINNTLKKYSDLPGLGKIQVYYTALDGILTEYVNEAGNEEGYSARVRYLEKLNYAAGTLKGHIEALLTHVNFWNTHLASRKYPSVVRKLTFSDEDHKPVHIQIPLQRDPLFNGGDISVSINLSSQVRSQYSKLFKSKVHSDVVFVIERQRISAHRTILAAQSQYFESLLFGSMKEAKAGDVVLRDVSPASFELLLQYAYTGCIELPGAHLEGLLKLLEVADRFFFVELKDALAQKLASLINVPSVLPILVSANQLSLTDVEAACFQFIDSNANCVLKEESLFKLHLGILIELLSRDTLLVQELSVYNAINGWMKKNGVQASDAPELLQCVRLTEIPEDKLLDLAQLGIFSEKDILKSLRVRMKQMLFEMRQRGKIDEGRNLFESAESCKIEGTVYWRHRVLASRSPPQPLPRASQQQLLRSSPLQQARQQQTPGLRSSPMQQSSNVFSDARGLLIPQVPQQPQQMQQQVQWRGGAFTTGGSSTHQPQGGFIYTASEVAIVQPASKINYNGVPNVPLVNVVMGTMGSGFQVPTHTPSPIFTVSIVFDYAYLLNYFEFCPYPEEPVSSRHSFGFSYTVEIQTSNSSWMTLFDYSSHTCSSTQKLTFPRLAIKNIRLKITKITNTKEPFTLSLTSCCLMKVTGRISFRQNGIIAPLQAIKPHFFLIKQDILSLTCPQALCYRLCQPYSISCIRVMLDGTWPSGSVGNVTISYGLAQGKLQETTLYNQRLNSTDECVVTFPEQVVNTISVAVMNIIYTLQKLRLDTSVGEDNFNVTNILIEAGPVDH